MIEWFQECLWGSVVVLVALLVVLVILIRVAVSQYREAKRKTAPVKVKLTHDQTFQAWGLIYQQSAESLRDLGRMMGSVNFAGLAGSITVLTTGKGVIVNQASLYIAIIIFCIGLVFSISPIAGLTERFRDDLSEAMARLAVDQPPSMTLHHPWPRGSLFFSMAILLMLLGAGVAALVFSLVGGHS